MINKAREYLRVSQDRSGRARSVDEQHADNVAASQAHGFEINGESYSDVSLSASRYASKVRGDFGRLLADLEHDRFGADVLVLWESSRGSRRVGEWATLLDLLEDARVKVLVTTHNRLYDPANWRDRKSLLEDAVDNEADSAKKSDAVLRAAAATAARGEPHGRMPYGYRRLYDPQTRRLIAQEPEPAEAAVVRELFERLGAGHSLRSIARDFGERGIRTRTGRPFTGTHLRDMALRPTYGGLRIHEPGNRSGRYRGSLEGAVPATWPGLVPDELFWRVRAMLLAPGRRTSRPGRGVHLLSMIAVCGPCGGPLACTSRRGTRQYQCHRKGCVRIVADNLDAYAEEIMVEYLASPDVISRLSAAPEDGGELARVRGELAQARAGLAEWRTAAGEGKVSVASFASIEPDLLRGITALETRERELSTPTALSAIAPGPDVAQRWQAAPMPARRQVARLLCSQPILGVLTVQRTPALGVRAAVHERVTWDRKTH